MGCLDIHDYGDEMLTNYRCFFEKKNPKYENVYLILKNNYINTLK